MSSPHSSNSHIRSKGFLLLATVLKNEAFIANSYPFFIIHHHHPKTRISNRISRSLIQVQSCLEFNQFRNETIGEDLDITLEGSKGQNDDEKSNHFFDGRYYKKNNSEEHSTPLDDIAATIVGEKQIDYVGAGTFGDIMSEQPPFSSPPSPLDEMNDKNTEIETSEVRHGLVTSTGGTLQSKYGSKISNLSPLDRIALTANGNLQRIFSSYYDAPVQVHVEKCERKESSNSIWLRTVNLSVFGQVRLNRGVLPYYGIS